MLVVHAPGVGAVWGSSHVTIGFNRRLALTYPLKPHICGTSRGYGYFHISLREVFPGASDLICLSFLIFVVVILSSTGLLFTTWNHRLSVSVAICSFRCYRPFTLHDWRFSVVLALNHRYLEASTG